MKRLAFWIGEIFALGFLTFWAFIIGFLIGLKP